MKCRTSWNAHCPCRHRAARDRFGRARLETKNDESRFGLTRAPFLKRRGSLERGQSLVRHRVAKSGIENYVEGPHLIAVLINEATSEWLAFVLAFIYGAAVMLIVIVTLVRSARSCDPESENRG